MRRAVTIVALAGAGALASCAAILGLDGGEPFGPGDGGRDEAATDAPGAADGEASAPNDGALDHDSAPGLDAAGDAGPTPQLHEAGVICGSSVCTNVFSGTKCSWCGGLNCVPYMQQVGPTCTISCDDTADCAEAGQICCGHPPIAPPPDVVSGASCASAPACGAGSATLCDPARPGECTLPATCKPFHGYYACQP
jgi:hypothetical protein